MEKVMSTQKKSKLTEADLYIKNRKWELDNAGLLNAGY